jgi:hypothetical protein
MEAVLQCIRKVAVHLGVRVAISRRRIVGPWTSLPTTFISAQLLSERTIQQVVSLLNCTATVTFSRETLICECSYWVVGARGGAVG